MPKRPSINDHGLDCTYFHKELTKVKRDLSYYRPDELARALARLAMLADSQVAVNTIDGMRQEHASELHRKV